MNPSSSSCTQLLLCRWCLSGCLTYGRQPYLFLRPPWVCCVALARLDPQLHLASAQVVLLLFLVVGSLLVGLFLGYHLLLARWNMTTYESYKWRDYKHHCLEAAVLDR